MSETVLAAALKESLSGCSRRLGFYGFDGPSGGCSYDELLRGARATSARLKALGVGPGSVVALLGPTSLELCRAALAVWLRGATLTVLPTPTRLGSLEAFLMETLAKLAGSQAGLLLGDGAMTEAFAPMLEIPVLDWERLENGRLPEVALSAASTSAALVQFSSGTTRDPQPILLSAEALLENSRAVLSCFPGGAEQHSCVSWLPLYHDMGLIGCFLMPLLASGDLTLMGPEVFAARPVTWLEAISRERATTSSAPNFALAYCADRISDEQMAGLDLSCWSIAMVGAEPVRPATLRRFSERFASVGFDARAFSPVYGLAEATLAVSFSPLGEGLKTARFDGERLASSGEVVPGDRESPSLGRPLPGVRIAIRAEAEVLGEDRLGDVYVNGPSLFQGYLGADAGDKLDSDGWLRTGDMGFLHQGELYLYGRRRDIVLLDGRNHDPSLLESAAEALEPLRRCCAFLREGEEKDALVMACEVAQSCAEAEKTLREVILGAVRAASGLTPALLLLVKAGSLPSTSSGKLRRSETARLHEQGALERWEPEPVAR